jgi:CRISPR-associated protein Csd2
MSESPVVSSRYDFVYLFDCQDGNPNGDPDFDNAPRFDPETFQGLVTDVCLKRKIRDYVALLKTSNGEVELGYRIFVMSGPTLESQQKLPYEDLKIEPKTKDRDKIAKARAWMCEKFFDVRAFGAVMSTTDFNCGQVRGPVQITFARSLHRVFSTEHSITRVAYTKEEKATTTTGSTEMGRKHTIAYGLYRTHGFINAAFAAQTGFTEADLSVLWRALGNMFDMDRSAARGLMCPRGLYIFKHSSTLGEAPAHKLFERVKVEKNPGVESPRGFSDYTVTVDDKDLPAGVTLTSL